MSEQPFQFGAVLAEAMAELEQADGSLMPLDDPIERLRLAAHQAVMAQTGSSFPKAGARVYLDDATGIATPEGHQLDVRY